MLARLERMKFWCQKVLPLVYDESISYYEVLCKVVEYLNDLIDSQNDIITEINGITVDVTQLKSDVAWLHGEIVKIQNGGYMDIYIEALAKWIDENLQEFVARIAKQVFFGLGGEGNAYFVAYIPESWSDIQFDTIMKCGDLNWGHLTLSY